MNDAMLQTILLVAIIIVAIALTGIVLLQNPRAAPWAWAAVRRAS